MRGSNINCRRDPLLFFPYVSLPKELRKGLAPRAALLEIFRAIEREKLYASERWTHVETFGNRKDEDKVAQLFQTILNTAVTWAQCGSNAIRTNWIDHSEPLIEGLRKPDVILVRSGTQSTQSNIAFKDILTYCEVKQPSTTDSHDDALMQLTDFCGFATASQLDRRFYICSSLCNRDFQLVAFIRGTTVMSEPLNIDSNPIPFITAILGLSAASPVWCGLDPDLAPVAAGVYKLTRKFCNKFTVSVGPMLLYAATDMHGKGTKVPLCEVWREYGKSPSMHPIKMSWMPMTYTNLSNDIDIAKLLVDRASSYPVLQGLEKDVFGPKDKYRIFSGCLESPADGSPTWDYENHWPGITIVLPDECERPLVPCPFPDDARWATGYYPDDYEPPRRPDTTRNILERFNVPVRLDGRLVNADWEPQEDDAIFQPPPHWMEKLGNLYGSCTVPAGLPLRELLDGFLGGLAGHFNGLMLNVMHCDISDTNLMFKVDKISLETVIPDWPVEKGTYPKRAGMLGDWGYGADLKKENSVRRITGTLPFMAADFLSGGPTQHAVRHDLESFFWALWIICVNMNGPYYTRRRWQDEARVSNKNPLYSSSVTTSTSVTTESSTSGVSSFSHISTVSGGATEMGGSFIVSAAGLQREDTFRERPYHESQSPDVTTRVPHGEDNPHEHAPPIWATPGRHNLSRRDVGRSKGSLSEEAFVNAISPYFRQSGSEFINGLRTLHTYFVKSRDPKKDELGDMTHMKFCEILKDMRDSISPDLDHTSDDDIQKARRRYNTFLKAGGTHGIAISVLDPPRPPRPLAISVLDPPRPSRPPKRRSEGEDDGKAPKKKASKALEV